MQKNVFIAEDLRNLEFRSFLVLVLPTYNSSDLFTRLRSTGNFKIVVFIIAILVVLTAISTKRKLPCAVLFVVAGLIIGFVAQLPNLALDPDMGQAGIK